MSILVPLLLLAFPASAGYLESQLEAASVFRADAEARLGLARRELEELQEFGLGFHRHDEPVELALLELDLAEAALADGFESIRWTLERAGLAAPQGWLPIELRLERARALLLEKAPDLAALAGPEAVRLAPLDGVALAMASGQDIRLRGYFAVNPVSAEFLAAQLAHEAVHVAQMRSAGETGRKFVWDADKEREARLRQLRLWNAIGRPELDFHGLLTEEAGVLASGEDAFARHVAAVYRQEPHWAWVAPEAAAPPAKPLPSVKRLEASAKAAGAADAKRLAKLAAEVRRTADSIRENRAKTAQAALERVRGALEQAVELAAPHPTIVTASLIESNRLAGVEYPPAMRRAYEALYPALDHVDRSKAALGLVRVSQAERERLERYRPTRDEALKKVPVDRVSEAFADLDGGALLAEKLREATLLLSKWPDPAFERAHPSWILVPGLRGWREEDAASAAAWAAHDLVHRRQGVERGAAPAPEQELDAVEAALQAFAAAGGTGDDSGERLVRLLAERAAWEEGGRLGLRLFLESGTAGKN